MLETILGALVCLISRSKAAAISMGMESMVFNATKVENSLWFFSYEEDCLCSKAVIFPQATQKL
jgi:hypothetical protein